MDKKMESTIMGYIWTMMRIPHSELTKGQYSIN